MLFHRDSAPSDIGKYTQPATNMCLSQKFSFFCTAACF